MIPTWVEIVKLTFLHVIENFIKKCKRYNSSTQDAYKRDTKLEKIKNKEIMKLNTLKFIEAAARSRVLKKKILSQKSPKKRSQQTSKKN